MGHPVDNDIYNKNILYNLLQLHFSLNLYQLVKFTYNFVLNQWIFLVISSISVIENERMFYFSIDTNISIDLYYYLYEIYYLFYVNGNSIISSIKMILFSTNSVINWTRSNQIFISRCRNLCIDVIDNVNIFVNYLKKLMNNGYFYRNLRLSTYLNDLLTFIFSFCCFFSWQLNKFVFIDLILFLVYFSKFFNVQEKN